MREWVNVNDRLPVKYTRVLAIIQHAATPDDGFTRMVVTCYLGEIGWLRVEEKYIVTFWMYCPAAPTE